MNFIKGNLYTNLLSQNKGVIQCLTYAKTMSLASANDNS